MNVRGMHIQVNQTLQQVAANATRKFLDEEIDLALNKSMDRFIQARVKPRKDGSGGFEIDQLSADAIRNILVTDDFDAYYYRSDRYVVNLPPDYLNLISDSAYVQNNCGQTPAELFTPMKVVYLKQNMSAKGGPKYYETLSITMDSKSVTIPGSLPYLNQYLGYVSKPDVVNLVPFILHQLQQQGLKVYWEKFNTIHKPSTYILTSAVSTVASLTVDGSVLTSTSSEDFPLKKHTNTTPAKLTANRLSNSAVVNRMGQSAFYKTSAMTPISELIGENLYIYTDSSFIVSKVRLTYVRKPLPISLALGTDCELAEDFHQAICDLTVEHLQGVLGNQAGAAQRVQDNEQRVVL